MKMEKLNDYQIKFLLSKQDLKDRNITFGDLFRHSDKLQGLVREIMKLASERINFNVTENPVMVEARPHPDGIVLIVSKTPEKNDSLINEEYKRHLANLYNEFMDSRLIESNTLTSDISGQNVKQSDPIKDLSYVFAFNDLSKLITACKLCSPIYHGQSTLYKLNSEYYLVLTVQSEEMLYSVRDCLCEYGELKRRLNEKTYFLSEYGDAIIPENAVASLADC